MRLGAASVFILSALIFSACGSGKDNNRSTQAPANALRTESATPAVYETELRFVRTGQRMGRPIEFTRPSEDANRPFTVKYKFNSGKNTALKIMRSWKQYRCDGVSPNGKFVLVGDSKTQELGMNLVNLRPQTSYVLEFTLGENQCETFKFGFTVWSDQASSQARPQFARRCSVGYDREIDLLFAPESPVAVLTSNSGKAEYLGYKRFCGVTVETTRYEERLELSPEYDGYSKVSSIGTTKDGNAFYYEAVFDNPEGKGVISCKKDSTQYAHLELSRCEDLILDRNHYE